MRNPILCCLLLLTLAASAALAATPARLERGVRGHERLAERRPAPGVFNDLGNLLLLDGRKAEAEEAYRQALSLDPEYATARLNLALLLSDDRRPRAAMRQLRKIVGQHPEHAWGHYYLGVLLADRGQTRRALRQFSRALALEPQLAEPQFNPHIVRNPLRTHAMLAAYVESPPAANSPRVYDNPRRVTRQLMPSVAPRRQKRSRPAAEEQPASPEQPAPNEQAPPQGGRP